MIPIADNSRRSKTATALAAALQPFAVSMSRFKKWFIRPIGTAWSANWLRIPLFTFIITRLFIFFAGYLSLLAFPVRRGYGLQRVFPDNLFIDGWIRWDSFYYLEILNTGYTYLPDQQCNAAFFPLYPLVGKLFTVFTDEPSIALLLTSLVCFFGALIYLYKLAKLEFDSPAVAERTIFYFAIFPLAFVFNSVYSESLFALVTIGAFYYARQKRWLLAGLFALLASATRSLGVLLWGVLWLEWLGAHGWTLGRIHKKEAWMSALSGMRRDWTSLLAIQIAPLGLVAFMVHLYQKFGDPWVFVKAQAAWGREFLGPVEVIFRASDQFLSQPFITGKLPNGETIQWIPGFQLLALFFAVFMGIAVWRRLGASYGLYTLLSVIIPASSSMMSIARIAGVCFPVFFIPAVAGQKEGWNRAIIFISSLFLAIFTARFVTWNSGP